jgi:alpha-beta hydrolase superfamily lysophospholipase
MSGLAWSSERESLKRIASQLPVLVASGDHDPVSRMGKGAKDLQAVLQSSGIKKVDLKLYSGARHELFLESNRQEFYQDLLNWIQVSTKLDESKH